eukprot:TRINITY_DN6101_c0_g1_i1.p1 TRINITY_DN6101_c0_g1~~TRINITY_DN6101_c0_g1_i1.p1  ORF type:complete len:138 (-),score=7.95 TRINITY_DN6101_c0_g1_i1:579-992(-)
MTLQANELDITSNHFSSLLKRKIGWNKGQKLPSKFITQYINKSAALNMIRLYHTTDGTQLLSSSAIEQAINHQFTALHETFQPSSPISFPPLVQKISQPVLVLLKAPISHNEVKSSYHKSNPCQPWVWILSWCLYIK